ncbi:FMN reductase [Neomicrococcus lactis]
MNMKIVVVSGGIGVPSTATMLGEHLGNAAQQALLEQGQQAEVSVVSLRDYAVAIANNLVSGFPSPELQEVKDLVVNADGLVLVSPTYTASVSGLFKSFIDTLDPKSLDSVPLLLAATGGSARHSLMIDYVMRPMFAYMRANIVPTSVFAAPEDWGADQSEGPLMGRVARAGKELATAMSGAARTRPVDNSMTSLPFEQLLANLSK